MRQPRLLPRRLWWVERFDPVLVFALIAIVSSYALGYHLDWNKNGGLGPMAAPSALPSGAALAKVLPALPAQTENAPAAATPNAEAQPQPIVSDGEWQDMTAELSFMAERYHGRVAIYMEDLKSGKTWTYHPDDLFPSASLVKVPIMACVFYKIKDGEMSLNQTLTLRRHNRVGGSGSLKWFPDGSRFTVRDLVTHMIAESDNTATNMLLEAVTLGYAQRKFAEMGLLYTGIYRDGMSLKGGHVAHENYTTAREMNMLITRIYQGALVDQSSSRMMLDFLRHKKPVATRLAKGLPRGWEIAHKTGLERQACHDAAVFLTPRGDYALVVLTGQNNSYHVAKNFITRLGHITFAHYGGIDAFRSRYFAKAWHRHSPVTAFR